MYDKIVKSILLNILAFFDWDETGDINSADYIRIACIICAILMTPRGVKIWTTGPLRTAPDITFFEVIYDILSMCSAALIVICIILLFIYILNEFRTIKLYKYR